MSVTIDMSNGFAHLAGLPDSLEVNGDTVQKCLDDLAKKRPGARKWLFDKKGKPLVFVSLNQSKSNVADLKTAVKDGDVLGLVMMLGGG